ncbi:MAG: hypothetical protein EON48_08000 [Acetobacteraceae bacterium]|nr:MAG: hypothetical protein EON48_08000 [Acetobacteraceae bacterium]
MRLLPCLAFALLLAAPGVEASRLPPDVMAYAARHDRCDHWRGEASDDPGRAAEVRRAVTRECRGSDAALARLLRRYARNKAVTKHLESYDLQIER